MAKPVTLEDALAHDEDQQKAPAPDSANTPAPRTEPQAGGKKNERSGMVKLTIELEPELHRQLKRFALLDAEDASLASLIRAAVVVMGKNERYAKAVINEAANQMRRRG